MKLKNTNFTDTKPSINDIEINKIVVFNWVTLVKECFKYFISYKDGKKARPLCVMLPRVSACRRNFHETKCISFWLKNFELLEKHNEI